MNQMLPRGDRSPGIFFTGALALTLGALAGFAGLLLFRSGLGDAPATIGGVFLFTILPVWFSAWAVSRCGADALRGGIAAFLSVLAGILLPVAGLFLGPATIVLAALTLALCLVLSRGHFGKISFRPVWIVLLASLTGLLLIVAGAPFRLFTPETMIAGTATSDNYWHVAIMQMITHYGSASIGADGLVHQNYHFLFHIIVAGMARALEADLPLVYGYWTVLTVKVQLVWGLYCAGVLLFRAKDDASSAPYWRLTYAWVCALLAFGFETESYVLGIALLAAYLPLMLALLRGGAATDRLTLVSLAVLCAGVFFVATAKASAGYFAAIGLFLLMWNYRTAPRIVALLAATLLGLAIYTEALLIPREVIYTQTTLPILVFSYLIYFGRGVLMHYILPALLVLIFVWRPHVRFAADGSGSLSVEAFGAPVLGNADATPAWLRGRLFRPVQWLFRADVNAQFVFLLLLGHVFVLFAFPIGDNIWDFSAILYALALLLLPVAVGETLGITIMDRPVRWGLAVLLAAGALKFSTLFLFSGGENLQQTIVSLYRGNGAETGKSGAKEDLVLSLKTTGTPFARLRARLDASPLAVIRRDMAAQAASVDGRMVVNIAPEATEVWRYFEHVAPLKWCAYSQLAVPALTGLLEIRSIPPAAINQVCAPPGITWFGFGKDQDLHRTANFTPAQLCALARPFRARKVYRLVSYSNPSRNQSIACNN